MAKQFVTEIHQANSVVILLNGVDARRYNKNPAEFEGFTIPALDGKAEYEEITEGNKVHYWIWVPDLITSNEKSTLAPYSPVSAYEKKKMERRRLEKLKKERIARYAWQVAFDGEIVPTDEDYVNAAALQKIITRKVKDRKNFKNTLVSMLNPQIFEDEFYPDNV